MPGYLRTEFFGGHAGEPYDGSDGVLIAKYPNQSGINAVQIEFFTPDEAGIAELMDGVSRGYLMQAHAGVDDAASIAGYVGTRAVGVGGRV